MLGDLSLKALPQSPVTAGGAILLVAGGLAVVALLFYFKRWGWLWREWLTSLDPKKIGVMYMVVATLMLLRGATDAAMIRLQQALASGNPGMLSPDLFQQVFTAHGTIMIFFVAMGFMFGLINLVLPLQLGARDVALPFANSVSFWLFAAGAALMNLSLVVGGEFAATGWLAYPPLSELRYSPGPGVDYWIWSLQIAGAGSLLAGINFLVTILKMRCPGMSLMKMPMFSWSVLGSMALVVFAFPILTATLGMLALDRLAGTHFFTADFGGNPMMYVNLIWAWGHPEVYILVLPAFGIFSEVVATFSRKRLFGYASMVWAIAAITFLSFIVWLHHFFTMGAGANVNAFFGIMTMVIAVPTGVKVFNWLFTMYRGRIRFDTPMLWFLGFVATFTVGGMAGVLLAIPAINFQIHNSLFLVAHFHTMIIGGVLFGFFAGITYWFPKIFGFKLNERIGRWAFWCWLVGFLAAFVPLYILGLMGATRRMDSYDSSLGWQGLFVVSAAGAAIIALGIALQLWQVAYSWWKRADNRDLTGDPWDGRTLEWSTSSPVPAYNFAVIPSVKQRDQFWEDKRHGLARAKLAHHAYRDIKLYKNSPLGLVIAGCAFLLGFSLIWHIWWLALIALAAVAAAIFWRSLDEDTERLVPAALVAKLEAARQGGRR
ncbi:MAG: cytochrome o ubiquinol oxidase subunit I [Candidatus Chaera renei]|uniref:Cytochrome o ubiquinol oxidase subunit I n=1 Tax=Candidatus Chaera renei TaxID=2506947 RepID=A0A4Q0AJ60_9BACT|nr:MAG: cytochrome o ubiquinol oxidase subunit I [Candidatus Chaera renei]